MLTYAQSTLRLWAGHSAIAQHFYPPVATALAIVPFGFKGGWLDIAPIMIVQNLPYVPYLPYTAVAFELPA